MKLLKIGDRGGTVVKVLCYNSEGRWFGPSWCQWIFHWHKILLIALWPWDRLSLWQKWVPGVFPGGKGGRCVRLKTYHHPVLLSRHLGTLTSWNPLGLSRSVMGLLYLYLYFRLIFSSRPSPLFKKQPTGASSLSSYPGQTSCSSLFGVVYKTLHRKHGKPNCG